jgi:effector-binding domain-containing protein
MSYGKVAVVALLALGLSVPLCVLAADEKDSKDSKAATDAKAVKDEQDAKATEDAADAKKADDAEAAAGALRGKADQTEPVVSDVRVRTLKESHYFYASTETTLATMGPEIERVIGELEKVSKAGTAREEGAWVFVYHGATGDPNKKITLEMGFQCPEDTKPQGQFKVRKLDAFRCASVVMAGPLHAMEDAYRKVVPEAQKDGRQMTGESREYYCYFESPDSPNNIVLVGIGIK